MQGVPDLPTSMPVVQQLMRTDAQSNTMSYWMPPPAPPPAKPMVTTTPAKPTATATVTTTTEWVDIVPEPDPDAPDPPSEPPAEPPTEPPTEPPSEPPAEPPAVEPPPLVEPPSQPQRSGKGKQQPSKQRSKQPSKQRSKHGQKQQQQHQQLVSEPPPSPFVPSGPSGPGTLLDQGVMASIKAGTGAGKSKSFQKRYHGLPAQGAIVSFEVMFSPGFEWSCRGKVGGINIGPGTSSGCNYSTNGASLRLMWEAKRIPPTPFAYVYVPQGSASRQPPGLRNPPKCGQGLFQDEFKGMLTTGAWFRVQLGVLLNSAGGRPDGRLLFSVNGRTKVLDGVVWRLGNEKIESLTWNVFHGGGCAATKQSSLQIRDVRVSPWA